MSLQLDQDTYLGLQEQLEMGRALKVWWNFEDFINPGYDAMMAGIWYGSISGTGASIRNSTATSLRPGLVRLSTGTTNAGSAALYMGINSQVVLLFGAGSYTIEADIYIATLSTVTETYTFQFGFGDVTSSINQTDGAYFQYSDVGSTPNWYRCTESNTTATTTDTTVAAVAGAWTRLKIVVNADATSVEFFINGTSVGSNTTNIPTGTGRETSAILSIIKSAGTTARTVDIDWVWLHVDLTTSR